MVSWTAFDLSYQPEQIRALDGHASRLPDGMRRPSEVAERRRDLKCCASVDSRWPLMDEQMADGWQEIPTTSQRRNVSTRAAAVDDGQSTLVVYRTGEVAGIVPLDAVGAIGLAGQLIEARHRRMAPPPDGAQARERSWRLPR